MNIRGAAIRKRREALGSSLEAVAAATRIPVAHLEAIEAERLDELPAGPYAAAYVRALCAHLGIEDSSSEDVAPLPATPPQGAPLWFVRGLAGASILALAGLVVSLIWERIAAELPAVPESAAPEQQLVIVARQTTRLRVEADGTELLDREVAGGEKLEFAARERLEVDVRATSHVRIEWNGVVMVPQGRQDAPRKLVFVDDRGVQW